MSANTSRTSPRTFRRPFGRQDQAEVVAGAICVLVLALAVEGSMALLQRRVNPLRQARR